SRRIPTGARARHERWRSGWRTCRSRITGVMRRRSRGGRSTVWRTVTRGHYRASDGVAAGRRARPARLSRGGAPSTRDPRSNAAGLREPPARRPRSRERAGERRRVEVALVERDAAVLDHARDDARLRGARADRADAAMAFGDGVDLGAHPRGGEEGVLAAIHR